MKFTIITAVHNNSAHLEEAIKSVLSQTYPDIEYIIVDGGSDDGSVEIIKNYSGRISKFVSGPDDGIYDALNKGILMADGDVIGLIHSDDIFSDTGVIQKIADVFNSKNADSVYSDLVYVHKSNSRKILRYWKAGEFKDKLLMNGWMPPHPTFFLKKSVYEKFGLFDTSYKIASDYELILRFLVKYKISTAYLPEVTIKMRTGGASNKSILNIKQKSMEDYKALKLAGFPLPAYTLFCKNLRKLPQFFRREQPVSLLGSYSLAKN